MDAELNSSDLLLDFDTSVGLKGLVGELLTPEARSDLEFLRTLYLKNRAIDLSSPDRPRIPKVIHQIWLGSEMPERFKVYQRSWREFHPDWDLRLWTNREVQEFDSEHKDLYEETGDYGRKSDILRAEILQRYGGLYVDVDYECLKPLDIFHHRFEFYCSMRLTPLGRILYPSVVQSPVCVCNSIVGSVAGHPVLAEYLACVRRNASDPAVNRLIDDVPSPRLRNSRAAMMQKKFFLTILSTFRPFHDAVMSKARIDGSRVVAMPPTFFNPLDPWWNGNRFRRFDYWKATVRSTLKHGYRPYRSNRISEHTYAIHYSTASWLLEVNDGR